MPLPNPPLEPRGAPPRVRIPPLLPARGIPPLPLAAPADLEAAVGVEGVRNLEAALLLGGLSTNDVSVVRNVASRSSGPWEFLKLGLPRLSWFCGRSKESAIGACYTTSVIEVIDWIGDPLNWMHTPQGSRRRKRSYSCRTRSRRSSRRSAPDSRASVAAAQSSAPDRPWRR